EINEVQVNGYIGGRYFGSQYSRSACESVRADAVTKCVVTASCRVGDAVSSRWVISTTSVSKPQLKSNRLEDRVMHNNSEGKKQQVEDHRTVKFGNDQIAPILGYGDLVQGNVTIKRKSTCYIRDLKGNDLLIGSRRTYLYSITLQDTSTPNPICLMAKATSSQAWLWHRRLSYLNFDSINLLSKNDIVNGLPKLKFVKDHLCSSCELGKAKQKSFHTKTTPSSKRRLQLLHMDVRGPMRVESNNGKKYILVIVDDYSRYTWTHFLRSKDETPTIRTDKGTEFLNKNLHAYFAQEGIKHQTSTARTPEQNGVVERWNRTLVEAARTMLSAAKVPLFFWAEAIATTCFTQNRSLVISRHEKTPYQIINGRKPSVRFFHIFGSLCYIIGDGKNLDKMKEKAPTVTPTENINQAETPKENAQVEEDEFINIFSTPVHEQGETSSRYVDSLNMHTFYQRHPSEHHWTKDHPLEQVIGNPSQSIRTRSQLETDGKMCMFALTMSQTEPKNIKEVMADSAWIEAIQEELHQFDRLDI
ncbi:retrovirus-related pol polyprotein from transposon TNT 1-94, partial [Tanacetum coccineum]